MDLLRKPLLVGAALLAFVTALTPAAAGPTAGGIASDNIEYIRHVPFDAVTATGARVIGKYMYVTSWRNFSIYDISDPLNPQLLSTRPFGFAFENEDVATDGKIMLFSESLPRSILHIWDVEDKSNPQEIAQLPGAGDHTMSCILRCRWGYGSDGAIVDLRDPHSPKLAGDWVKMVGITRGNHDVEEFKNGFVLTTPYEEPFHLLDVRDPLKPKVLATGAPPPTLDWWYHSTRWPRAGADDFIVMEGEGTKGPLLTFDATKWKKTHTFTKIDEFTVEEGGNYLNGRSDSDSEGSHWFDDHPKFRNGGLLAAGWYSHGTRIVEVSSKGKMKEVGYFLPYAGSTFASYWITDEVIYGVDLNRGIDILRYTGKV